MTVQMRAVTALVQQCRDLEPHENAAVRTAFEDTLAVTYAGWNEPSARAARNLHPAGIDAFLSGTTGHTPVAQAMVLATAGHALDYDDVQLTSVTHPSVVLVPALLALANRGLGAPERLLPAFAVGLAVNLSLGRALGPGHYAAGWHATSTIGPVAAAAAAAHLMRLDERQTRHALALAAAQAGGMQINFGSDAKPLQAGFAAAAAVRAALLARAGASASDDPFEPRGFLDLYGGDSAAKGEAPVEIDPTAISRKLFPCCYAAHRMIAAALEIHGECGPVGAEDADRVVCTVPQGLLTPLRITQPKSGNEGKFCGAYLIAAALMQGQVGLGDFTDEAIGREAIRRLMAKVELEEEAAEPDAPPGLDRGAVRLSVLRAGDTVGTAVVRHYPGSPQQPATGRQTRDKIADCLAHHARAGGDAIPVERFRARVGTLIGQPEAAQPIAEGAMP